MQITCESKLHPEFGKRSCCSESVEKYITKATLEVKFTATLGKDKTMEKKSTNSTTQEKSKKFQNPICKKRKTRLQ